MLRWVKIGRRLPPNLGHYCTPVHICGLPYCASQIRKAVAFSDFEELQRQERAGGFRERPAMASSFFRRGQVGSWREELSPALVRQIVDAHGPTMRRFGYLDANDQPV